MILFFAFVIIETVAVVWLEYMVFKLWLFLCGKGGEDDCLNGKK